MQHSNSRVFAVVGVVMAATAAAIIGIPVLLVLAVSGAAHYGVLASSIVAVVVAVITCVVSCVVAAFAFATALSGSVTGLVLALVLFGSPALRADPGTACASHGPRPI